MVKNVNTAKTGEITQLSFQTKNAASHVPNEQEQLWLVGFGVGVTLQVVVSPFMLAPTGTANVLFFKI